MVKAAAQHDLGVAAKDYWRCYLDRAESATHRTPHRICRSVA